MGALDKYLISFQTYFIAKDKQLIDIKNFSIKQPGVQDDVECYRSRISKEIRIYIGCKNNNCRQNLRFGKKYLQDT